MNAPHDALLDIYFWNFIDAGVPPAATPLFIGRYKGRPLVESVANCFNLTTESAETVIEAARQEVAF